MLKELLYTTLLLLLFTPFSIQAQTQTAQELLTKSIQYHDAQGKWEKAAFNLPLHESRPSGAYRLTDITLDNQKQSFELTQIRGKDRVYRYISPESCKAEWNYKSEVPDNLKKRLRLNCEGGNAWYRNYYAYLYGLPMKLKDPGTHIAPEVKKKAFFGKELLEIKVTYDPEVGKDIWYFYFDPQTYALSGYRFYHDESANDGEYILLEGEININGLKLPKKRSWYTHKEDKHLGDDELLPYTATKY